MDSAKVEAWIDERVKERERLREARDALWLVHLDPAVGRLREETSTAVAKAYRLLADLEPLTEEPTRSTPSG